MKVNQKQEELLEKVKLEEKVISRTPLTIDHHERQKEIAYEGGYNQAVVDLETLKEAIKGRSEK